MAIKRLLLLSGAMGVGKSSIADVLKEKFYFSSISSGEYLRERQKELSSSRARYDLQELGDQLDIETNSAWLIDSVAVPAMASAADVENWLLDAVRKPKQVNLFRQRFGNIVKHVHLFASEAVLESRYLRREQRETRSAYATAIQHPNEIAARALKPLADKAFDTTRSSILDISEQIANLWEK